MGDNDDELSLVVDDGATFTIIFVSILSLSSGLDGQYYLVVILLYVYVGSSEIWSFIWAFCYSLVIMVGNHDNIRIVDELN